MARRTRKVSVSVDPFESVLLCSLLFGSVFVATALIKLVLFLLVGAVSAAELVRARRELVVVFGSLVGFGVAIGPVVAVARRWMGPTRSLRAKNVVAGGLVGGTYALGCTILFSNGMDAVGKIAVGAFTLLGVWWAVASALNELVG